MEPEAECNDLPRTTARLELTVWSPAPRPLRFLTSALVAQPSASGHHGQAGTRDANVPRGDWLPSHPVGLFSPLDGATIVCVWCVCVLGVCVPCNLSQGAMPSWACLRSGEMVRVPAPCSAQRMLSEQESPECAHRRCDPARAQGPIPAVDALVLLGLKATASLRGLPIARGRLIQLRKPSCRQASPCAPCTPLRVSVFLQPGAEGVR